VKNLRIYGNRPFSVAVIHGGPGAPGEMAPVARELSIIRGVLEPLQTKASLEGQIEELHDVLEEHADFPVKLIGWSWGAMLGFIFTARYPSFIEKLILIGSGPFEEKYAASIVGDRFVRLSEEERVEVFELIEALNDPATRDKNTPMGRLGGLFSKADTYDSLPHKSEVLEYQHNINDKVWQQAKELRISGELLELGWKIRCPVVAIHGDYDPHPAEGVREPLSRVLKDFRFMLLENCGHEPWTERAARDKFYQILENELE
jgi:pimeloyl-ACP methyl ester carboxylesterase